MIHTPTVFVECDSCGYEDKFELEFHRIDAFDKTIYHLEDITYNFQWYKMGTQIWCDTCYENYSPKKSRVEYEKHADPQEPEEPLNFHDDDREV